MASQRQPVTGRVNSWRRAGAAHAPLSSARERFCRCEREQKDEIKVSPSTCLSLSFTSISPFDGVRSVRQICTDSTARILQSNGIKGARLIKVRAAAPVSRVHDVWRLKQKKPTRNRYLHFTPFCIWIKTFFSLHLTPVQNLWSAPKNFSAQITTLIRKYRSRLEAWRLFGKNIGINSFKNILMKPTFYGMWNDGKRAIWGKTTCVVKGGGMKRNRAARVWGGRRCCSVQRRYL